MARHYMEGFGDPGTDAVMGPVIGGGTAAVGAIAARAIFGGQPMAKWSPLIGSLVGALVGGGLMFSPKYKGIGMSALISALLVGVPRQLEDALVSAGVLKGDDMSGYLGVITPEQFGDDMSSPVQLLDPGAGSTGVLGVHVPEQMSGFGDEGMQGPSDVELLGGFGSNFLSAA